MSSFNKIFAAILTAGIVAMLSNFIAEKAVHSEELTQDAVAIAGKAEVGEHGGGGAQEAVQESILPLLAGADIERGAKLSKVCAACHSFEKDGPVKQGPSLWGVVGAEKGHHPGFTYSKGMQEKGGTWDYEALSEFLSKPKAYIQGTKMTYAGMKKIEDRAAIVGWLRTLADAPAPLPTAGEAPAAADGAEEAPVE